MGDAIYIGIFLLSFIVGWGAGYLGAQIKKKPDGEIEVVEDALGVKTFTISLDNDDPWNLDRKDSVIFKIKSTQTFS